MGFFDRLELKQISDENITITEPECGKCKLNVGCKNPYFKQIGSDTDVLVVLSPPNKRDDSTGKSSQVRLLERALANYKPSVYGNGSITRIATFAHALCCATEDQKLPDKHFTYCRPNLLKAIQAGPKIIIPLGSRALRSLLPFLLGSKKKLGNRHDLYHRWYGWQIPDGKLNAWVCPTFSVNAFETTKNDVLKRMFCQHIDRALQLDMRPWDNVPEYHKEVKLLYTIREIMAYLEMLDFHCLTGPITFDIECNCLTPELPDAKIKSFSFAIDGLCFAFPYENTAEFRPVRRKIREIMASQTLKIAYNLKYEDRWMRKFKMPVSNWYRDGMIMSHILDGRGGINSLKHQAYVHLGIGDYNSHLEDKLNCSDASGYNKIDEIPIKDLLLYNGMDSLLEHKLYHIQEKLLEKGNSRE